MRTRSTRWLRTLVLAIVPTALVSAAFVLVPDAAYAATVPSITTMGGPLNVLPSAVGSAATSQGGASGTQFEIMAQYLYRAAKSPEFWQRMAQYQQDSKVAIAAGKPAPAMAADLAAEAKTVYPLASKAAPFIKGAGAVGGVITAYDMSSSLTNGVQDLIGLDATGKVCANTGRDLWGSIVQTAAGADCAKYDQQADDFARNNDVTPGVVLAGCGTQASTGFACAKLTSSFDFTDSGHQYRTQCMSLTVNNDADWAVNAPGMQYMEFQVNKNGVKRLTQIGYQRPDYFNSSSGTCGSGKYIWIITELPEVLDGFRMAPSGPIYEGSEQSADPTRTLKCVIAGTDGNTYTGTSDAFKESDGVLPKVKCADLPAGVQAQSTKILETGGEGGDQTVWESASDPAVLDATKDGCGTSTGTQCQLLLYKNGKSCFDGADCQGWFTDPDQSKYRCEYGGKTVSLTECTTYAPRWEPAQQSKGNTLGNPTTGEPLKNPKPELSPGSTASAGSTPADNATDLGPNKCFQNMEFTLNPISWVVEPFKCMFIARDGYSESLQKQSQKAWDKTSPMRYAAAISAWDLRTPGDGCTGIPVSMHHGELNFDGNILAACPGDVLAPFAVWSRLFVGFSLSVVGVYALLRWGGALFGFEAFGRKGDDD